MRPALRLLVHGHQPRTRNAAVADSLPSDADVDEEVGRALPRQRTLERRRELDPHRGQPVVEVGVALLSENLTFRPKRLARGLEAVQTHVEAHRRPRAHVPRLVQLQRVHLGVEKHRPLLTKVIEHARDLLLGPDRPFVPIRLLDQLHGHQNAAPVRAALDVPGVHALRQLAHLSKPRQFHLTRTAVEGVPPGLLELFLVHDEIPEAHRLARDVVIRAADVVIHQRHLQRR